MIIEIVKVFKSMRKSINLVIFSGLVQATVILCHLWSLSCSLWFWWAVPVGQTSGSLIERPSITQNFLILRGHIQMKKLTEWNWNIVSFTSRPQSMFQNLSAHCGLPVCYPTVSVEVHWTSVVSFVSKKIMRIHLSIRALPAFRWLWPNPGDISNWAFVARLGGATRSRPNDDKEMEESDRMTTEPSPDWRNCLAVTRRMGGATFSKEEAVAEISINCQYPARPSGNAVARLQMIY